jgi:hypothetical protein
MNPYPLFTLNHFTVPVTLVAKRKQSKQSYNYMKSSALIKKVIQNMNYSNSYLYQALQHIQFIQFSVLVSCLHTTISLQNKIQ